MQVCYNLTTIIILKVKKRIYEPRGLHTNIIETIFKWTYNVQKRNDLFLHKFNIYLNSQEQNFIF